MLRAGMCLRFKVSCATQECTLFVGSRDRWRRELREEGYEVARQLEGKSGRFSYLICRRGAEAATKYPASLVIAVFRALKPQMVSDGAVTVTFSGPGEDAGDYSTELEGTWGFDG